MCIRNKGYQWTESSAGCFRGYIQPSGYPIPLRGEEALQYLSRANSFEGFLSLLNDLDGIYVIALWQEDGTVWAAVDSTRSIPLYYWPLSLRQWGRHPGGFRNSQRGGGSHCLGGTFLLRLYRRLPHRLF